MLPLSDINPTRRTPYLTYILIAINVLVFLWELTFSDQELTRVFLNYSVVPSLVGPRLVPAICTAHDCCWNRQPKGCPRRIPSAGDTAITFHARRHSPYAV